MVWGTIGFKIWEGLQTDNSKVIVQNKIESFIPKKAIEVDTFSIKEVVRDPFLGTIKKKEKPKAVQAPKLVEWLPIVYNGVLKNNKTGQHVYVLKINNKEQLLKIGNVVENVKLLRGTSKAVVVSYKGQQKTISYQE